MVERLAKEKNLMGLVTSSVESDSKHYSRNDAQEQIMSTLNIDAMQAKQIVKTKLLSNAITRERYSKNLDQISRYLSDKLLIKQKYLNVDWMETLKLVRTFL